jgi:hypothetical protein
MLDLGDFGSSPHAAEFGGRGLCRARHGKAKKGSPPKRRSVLNIWPWLPGFLAQWVDDARPQMRHAGGSKALWPSERGGRIGTSMVDRRLAAYRAALGLDDGIDFHSLRVLRDSPGRGRLGPAVRAADRARWQARPGGHPR